MNVFDTYPYTPEIEGEGYYFGIYPTDLILEYFIEKGLEWFRSDADAVKKVFSHFLRPQLIEKFGQTKIDEIQTYFDDHEISVIQSFPISDQTLPLVSIQLADAEEVMPYGGLNQFAGVLDNVDSEGVIADRKTFGYLPMNDSLLVGIHATSVDKVKYLYYLIAYIISSSVPQFEDIGLFNVLLRATDLSRLNEMMPANVFSRFMTVSVKSNAFFDKEYVPIVNKIKLNMTMGGE
jgi:hypothetical protein